MIEIPLFKYGEIEINYLKRGKGEPLVLLSGWGQAMGTWTFVISFFKRRMMVITLDHRGVGKSSRPNYPYTMNMFIDETNALLDFLEIKEKIHLLGVSMGGMTAQNFALKYPHRVKTLILLATSAYITNEMDILFEEYQKIMNELSPEEGFIKLIDLLFSESFIETLKRDKKLYQAVYEELMVKNKTRWQDYVNQAAAVRDHDTRDSLHEINQHTLIIHGTADKEVPFKHSEYLHANISNSTLIPLEGFGHGSLLIEDFERTNKIIWNFIEEHRD